MIANRAEGKSVTGNSEADAFLANTVEGPVLGALFDQQMRAELAFSGAYRLSQRIGGVDMARIAAMDSEEFTALFRKSPGIHRFGQMMASKTYQRSKVTTMLCFAIATGCLGAGFFVRGGATGMLGGGLSTGTSLALFSLLAATVTGSKTWRVGPNRLVVETTSFGRQRSRSYTNCAIRMRWEYGDKVSGSFTARPLGDEIRIELISGEETFGLYRYIPSGVAGFDEAQASGLELCRLIADTTGWSLSDRTNLA
jgi:hypothetical protein